MKRRCKISFIAIIFFPLLLGMSGLGGEAPGRIPMPEKKFNASFVDRMDIATEASQVSIDGGAFLAGKKGEGTFTFAFENIQYVDFLLREDTLTARLLLKDGNSQSLVMNKKAKAYGKTKYGTYQIRLLDLKRMTILGPTK